MTLTNLELLTILLSSLSQSAVLILLQTSILLLVGFALAFLVGRRRPALLSLIYRSLLVGVGLIGILSVVPTKPIRPLWNLSLPSYQATKPVQATPAVPLAAKEKSQVTRVQSAALEAVSKSATLSPPSVYALSDTPPSPTRQTPVLRQDVSQWLYVVAGIWLLVAAAKLIWLLLAGLYAARLRYQARTIDDPAVLLLLEQQSAKLQVPAPLLLSHPLVQVPFLSGLFRPAIVLPAHYQTDFDDAALQAILLHELAHLPRRDCWWKHLSGFVGSLLWMQPLVWLLRRRMEEVDEALCDETVLGGGCSSRTYAAMLLDLAERLSHRPMEQAAGVGIVSFRSSLGQRIQRIMENRQSSSFPLSFSARLGTVAAMMGLTSVLTLLAVDAAPQRPVVKPVKLAAGKTAKPTKLRNATRESRVGLPRTLREANGNATITGRVLYEDGRPATNIKVSAYSILLNETELWGYKRKLSNSFQWPKKIQRLLSGDAVTRADGTYRIAGLLPRRYVVYLKGDLFGNDAPAGWLAPDRGLRVDSAANQSRGAPAIVLRRGALIKIRVVDQASGIPLKGVTWRGFNVDEPVSENPPSTHVDARDKMRPMKTYDSGGSTDRNGYCTLTLDAGKAYFYMNGGMLMNIMRQPDPKKGNPPWVPFAMITSNGLYKANAWCEVTAPQQAPRRAWKGETEVRLQKGQVANFTIRLKRYAALTPSDKVSLKLHQKR